jgi:hypothetical protein
MSFVPPEVGDVVNFHSRRPPIEAPATVVRVHDEDGYELELAGEKFSVGSVLHISQVPDQEAAMMFWYFADEALDGGDAGEIFAATVAGRGGVDPNW